MSNQDRMPRQTLQTHDERNGAGWEQILQKYQQSLMELEENFNKKLNVARAQESTPSVKAHKGGKKGGIRIQDLLNAH